MKLGIEMFATEYAIRPDELARACEERGFESVWFPEHTHIPASRRTPFPAGGELPKEYSHTHDLFVSLMAAAAATKTIKLGSGICLAMERDPITMAKEVASVDQLSNGRVRNVALNRSGSLSIPTSEPVVGPRFRLGENCPKSTRTPTISLCRSWPPRRRRKPSSSAAASVWRWNVIRSRWPRR